MGWCDVVRCPRVQERVSHHDKTQEELVQWEEQKRDEVGMTGWVDGGMTWVDGGMA